MKAAVCYEFGKPLVVEELHLDPPQAGEVRVKLSACAICHSDIHYMDGAWGGRLPAVYGHEAAGVVVALGDGVADLTAGDHVVVTLLRACGRCFYCQQGEQAQCEATFPIDRQGRLRKADGTEVLQGLRTGAFAEEVVVHHSQVAPLPESVPLASASLLACGVITGLGAVVNTARVPPGASVVVVGAGGVGLNSIQGAALSGARTIVAVDVVESKLGAAREFGATHGINAADKDVQARVRELTDGRGADFVFVTVGAPAAIESAIGLMRRAGTTVIVGMPASGVRTALETVDFADAGQRVIGSKMGSTRLALDMPRLVSLYQQGRLKLDELITATYPLERINEAIDEVRRGEALRNVVLFG